MIPERSRRDALTYTMQIIPITLAFIFFILSLIHVYWVFGGKWGLEGAVPRNYKEEPLFMPGPLATAVVAIGLLGFALFYTSEAGFFDLPFLSRWKNIIGWIIPSIFLLRSIGDFKYCGITKKIRDTKFAELDNKYFTPLCIMLAILGYLVMII